MSDRQKEPIRLAIESALDEMYAAFADGRKPRLPSSVPRAYDAEWIGRQPLRELPADLVNDFACELGGLVGDAEDVRYFLPRLFDMLFAGKLTHLAQPPFLLAKLKMARWTDWSPREREAVTSFLTVYFDWCVSTRVGWRIVSLVTSLSDLFGDERAWLARIRARDDVAGVCALLWLAETEGERILKRRNELAGNTERRVWLRNRANFVQVESLRSRWGLVGPMARI